MANARTMNLLVLLLLGAAAAGALGVSLHGGFVWDDRPLIVENPDVRSLAGTARLLTSGFWETGDGYDRFRSFFRPVVSLSYAADHAIWGLEPAGYHLTNLLLHIICCWLVYFVARQESLAVLAAAAGAAAFAVHPVHVESVAWISGRTDLLCAVFFLGAWLAWKRAASLPAPTAARTFALFLYLLALLSKEMAATLPLLVFADTWLGEGGAGDRLRRGLRAMAPFLIVTALYLIARRLVLGPAVEPLYALDTLSWIATAIFVTARYVVLLLLPVGLDAHYPFAPRPGIDAPVVLSAIILTVVFAAWAIAARRDRRSAFWIGWTLVTLLPVLLFGSFGDILLADRFLYIPSVGICLLLSRITSSTLAASRPPLLARTAIPAVAVVLILLGWASSRRATVWKDDLALFAAMAETSPGSPLVRTNLGLAYYERGHYRAAEAELSAAVGIEPRFSLAWNNLGATLERQEKSEEALAAYLRAIETAPRQVETRANIARLLVQLGRVDAGLRMLEESVAQYPRSAPILFAYAEALDQAGRRDEAIGWLRRLQRIDPHFPGAFYMLGIRLYEQGRYEEAAEGMQRFLALRRSDDAYSRTALRIIAESRPGGTRPVRTPDSEAGQWYLSGVP